MRLLIIDKTAGLLSSHERHRALARLPDVDLHVFGPERWVESDRKVIWNSRDNENYERHLGKLVFPGYYARHFYYQGLFRTIRSLQPDAIQLFEEPWSLVAGQVLACSKISRVPALLFYTWENIYRPWTYPSRLSPVYGLIDRRMHRASRGALCATCAAEDVLRRKGYAHPTVVVPYAVSDRFFSESTRQQNPSDTFHLGYVGRLLWMKGVDLLVEAVKQTEGIRLTSIGSGEYENELRKRIAQLNLRERIEIIPAVPEDTVVERMRSFDALVLPSRTTAGWKEQLGRVLIEAMALGVPAVGSRCGAIPEVLGRNDLVFEEENTEELSNILNRLQTDSDWRREIVEYGRQRARERFTWEAFANQVGEFYRRLELL